MSEKRSDQSTDESSPSYRSTDDTLIDRREYLKYTGAVASTPIVAGQVGGAIDDAPRSTDQSGPVPVELRVEYTHDPFGIDNPEPLLSWRIHSTKRGTTQTAYRVLVASSPDELTDDAGDIWDSGIIEADSMNVRYDGPSLESRERYYWSVRIFDENGNASDWSDPAWWEMGLLDEDDWEAEWIRKPRDDDDLFEFNFFRKEFSLEDASIERARAYVSAYHQYEMRLNGEEVDMGPSFNEPDRQYYKVLDVTEQLETGENAVGILHNWSGGGQGRPHGEPGLIVQLEVEYGDGTVERMTTDETWHVRAGPWQTVGGDLIRAGSSQDPVEVIDGRDLPLGYSEPGFDDDGWGDPEVLGTHPTDPWEQLISQEREVTGERITPESMWEVNGVSHMTVTDEEYLTVDGGGVTLSDAGSEWTDYTMEFDARLPADTDQRPVAGWVFRAEDEDNLYMWQLGGEDGTGELRPHVREDGGYSLLDSVPFDIELGVWYHIRVELDGSRIRTYIDGELVDERTDETFTGGRVGFRFDDVEIGEFDNVRITDSEGTVLLTDDFSGDLNAWDAGGRSYVVDFGKVYSAIPRISFQDGEEGRNVDMVAGYRLTDSGQVDTERGVQSTDMRYEYTQRDGEQEFRPFLYLGYRYFQIDEPGEELERDQVKAFARWNDVPDTHAATLDSSNETLNDIWELSRHSLQYGSQEQFLDTPTREKGQFLGDAYNISWATMRTFEERKLSRQALREFFDSQERFWPDGRLNAVYPTGDGARDIPDYSQKFVDWVWRYYRVTGDDELLEESYPVIRNVADYVDDHVDENGLVVDLSGGGGAYAYGIVDWPDEMRYDYDRDTGAMTTVNVYGVAVFRRVAQVAEILGKSGDAAEMQSKEEALTEAINEHLVRDDGLYVDGLHYDGSQSDHISQHANAFPLAFDIVPSENVATVADYIVDQEVAMGPMTVHWLLYALVNAERYDAMVDLMTDPSHDGWANILDEGGTFLWESWHGLEADERNRSLSHPWGGVVNVVIQEALLGVTIEEPGATELAITPPPSGLDSASGAVPTEHGGVSVSWERTEHNGTTGTDTGIELSTSIPANTPTTIRIPTYGTDRVRVHEDGKTIWNNGNRTRPTHPGIESVERTDERVVVEVLSGEYEFELERIGN